MFSSVCKVWVIHMIMEFNNFICSGNKLSQVVVHVKHVYIHWFLSKTTSWYCLLFCMQLSSDQYTIWYLHGNGICVRRGAVWIYPQTWKGKVVNNSLKPCSHHTYNIYTHVESFISLINCLHYVLTASTYGLLPRPFFHTLIYTCNSISNYVSYKSGP